MFGSITLSYALARKVTGQSHHTQPVCGRAKLSNIPCAVQNVEPPEETNPEAHAVQGGSPSEPREFGGHWPGRTNIKREIDWVLQLKHVGQLL